MVDELEEYDRFLLDALLQHATREAGRPLKLMESQALTDDFLNERAQVKKARMAEKMKATRSHNAYIKERQAHTDFQWKPPLPKRK